MDKLKISATVCSFVSLVLLIISLVTDHWVVGSIFHLGLWKVCPNNYACRSIGTQVSGFIHSTRAFLLVGVLAGAASLFGFCVSFYQRQIGPISAAVLAVRASLTAGISTPIAMSTFTYVYSSYGLAPGESFGWSFGTGWASSVLFLITGGLAYKIVSDTTQE
ncbi:protein NKG7-like [Sphaerodactylus townsendi]|uniref:protein NKG7-like n=1 Tax=Sphaerodactylus townsendi TaxID=933632 RepID=UPI002025C6AD|nr:protein NKG7-like [Sphaerodactylus townsendi]